MVITAELIAAVAAVMAEVGQIEKDRRISDGPARYEYLSDDAVVARIQSAMARHTLALIPAEMTIAEHTAIARRSGEPMPGVRLLVTWHLVHSSGGWLRFQSVGEGADSGDKGSNKAMTAARKYAMRLAFSIASGEDPDDVRPESGATSEPAAARQPASSTPARAQASAPPPPSDDPSTAAARASYKWLRQIGEVDTAEKLVEILKANENKCPDAIGTALADYAELGKDDRLSATVRLLGRF